MEFDRVSYLRRRIYMDGLNAEQQALLASIMGNSSQAQALRPNIPTPAAPAAPAASVPFTPPAGDTNRVLSQAEIDALFASMT